MAPFLCCLLAVASLGFDISASGVRNHPAFLAMGQYGERVEYIETFVSEIRTTEQGWRRIEATEVCLYLLIIVLSASSALVAALSARSSAVIPAGGRTGPAPRGGTKKDYKVIEIILCAATTIVGGIIASKDTFFGADVSGLRQALADADGIIQNIMRLEKTPGLGTMSPDDFGIILQELNTQHDKWNQILGWINHSHGSGPGSALPIVFAQEDSKPPEWIKTLPVDAQSMFFRGMGADPSLSKAQAESFDDAMAQLTSAFELGPPYVPTQIRKALIRSAYKIHDSFFVYDEKHATFNYYTLLQISRNLRRTYASPIEYTQHNWHPVDLTFDPVSGLIVLDKEGGVSRVTVADNAIHITPLSQLPIAYSPAAITSDKDSIFVSADAGGWCTLKRLFTDNQNPAFKTFSPELSRCTGVASDTMGVYVSFPFSPQLMYWDPGSNHTSGLGLPIQGGPSGVGDCALHYDILGRQLILSCESGASYRIPISPGMRDSAGHWLNLPPDLGSVHAITSDAKHLMFASGSKVLFVSKDTYNGENPPEAVHSLRQTDGHTIHPSGIAVDSSDSLWLVDSNRSLLKGPFPIE